jgi:hypothetical protein
MTPPLPPELFNSARDLWRRLTAAHIERTRQMALLLAGVAVTGSEQEALIQEMRLLSPAARAGSLPEGVAASLRARSESLVDQMEASIITALRPPPLPVLPDAAETLLALSKHYLPQATNDTAERLAVLADRYRNQLRTEQDDALLLSLLAEVLLGEDDVSPVS